MPIETLPTIASARRDLDAGRMSATALLEGCLARIDRHEARVGSLVLQTRDEARRRALRADTERRTAAANVAGPLSPLHGIPYSLKDIVETAGIRTAAQSCSLANHVPLADAEVERRMKTSGAVLLGKASTWEFAHGGPSWDVLAPPARNPWRLTHDPSGSSSGSAAGIAAGFCLGSIGSDTGGSIRGPAAVNGVVGLKPTYGRVSRVGVIGNSFTHDHVGPIAWTAEDAAHLLQVIAGYDPRDAASAQRPVPNYTARLGDSIDGLRIGVPYAWFDEQVPASHEVREAFDRALRVLENLGAVIRRIALPPIRQFEDSKKLIAAVELFATHADALRRTPELLGQAFRVRVFGGALVPAEQYVNAHRLRKELAARVQAHFEQVDIIALPTAEPAKLLLPAVPEKFFNHDGYLTPFCVSGHPALSTRAGFSSDGLPLSLQLVGRHFDEALVLQVAHRYEQASDWAAYRPGFL